MSLATMIEQPTCMATHRTCQKQAARKPKLSQTLLANTSQKHQQQELTSPSSYHQSFPSWPSCQLVSRSPASHGGRSEFVRLTLLNKASGPEIIGWGICKGSQMWFKGRLEACWWTFGPKFGYQQICQRFHGPFPAGKGPGNR